MTDYENEDEVHNETEPKDFDFVEEDGKVAPAWSMIFMQLKELQHYTKASDFLLKIFGKKQGVQSYHRR